MEQEEVSRGLKHRNEVKGLLDPFICASEDDFAVNFPQHLMK